MSGRSPRKAASANTHAPTHAPVRRVAAEGDSSCWKAQKDNHSTIGDAFLAWIADNDADLSAKWGTSWDAVPESHACDCDIHAVAAGYLADAHPQAAGANKGQLLHYSTAEAYWGGMLQTVHRRFRESELPQTQVCAQALPTPANLHAPAAALPPPPSLPGLSQVFLRCVSAGASKEKEWCAKIKANMKKQIIARKVEKGEKLDCSANELYLMHIEAISAALTRANFKEAADRKLAIKTLWVAAGRSSEPAALSLRTMSWNALHDAPVIESFQSKPGKLKFVVLIAAPNRHASWLLDFGDCLTFDHGMASYTEGEQFWLLPDLGGAANAGTKLSNYVKALQPAGRLGALKKYYSIGCDVP